MQILSETQLGKEAHRIISMVKEKYLKDYKNSVRTRCRQLYGYLFRTGILSTLSYTYAKGGESLIKSAFKWIKSDSQLPPNGEEEDVGYAIYAASFCLLFEKIGYNTEEASLNKVIEILTSNPETTLMIEIQSLKFARWLKIFAEALLSEKE